MATTGVTVTTADMAHARRPTAAVLSQPVGDVCFTLRTRVPVGRARGPPGNDVGSRLARR